MKASYFSRDLTWLSFNARILAEAQRSYVPLLERLSFIAIYSSNLDEFFRVRMPLLLAYKKLKKNQPLEAHELAVYKEVRKEIVSQQVTYGAILRDELIPALKQENIYICYHEEIPEKLKDGVSAYFYTYIAAYLEKVDLQEQDTFFPQNNILYFLICFEGDTNYALVKIPSDLISRFYHRQLAGIDYVLFIDDIIRELIPTLFSSGKITGIYSFKITRDAELNLKEEINADIALQIEQEIAKRDFGLATRMLYQPDTPEHIVKLLAQKFGLKKLNCIAGGYYHNLKDFLNFPIKRADLKYPKQPTLHPIVIPQGETLFSHILQQDFLINTPYESYDSILRFFNEAAINPEVTEISTTMYRVASDSRIIHALISASNNGKKVTVFVELKARFDEANNIKWAKRMKANGIYIIYSIPKLKVHSKVALVKLNTGYLGLLSTGNLNENTAKIYGDHILLTANQGLLLELKALFNYLELRKLKEETQAINFQHLIVAQFNLQERFIQLIDAEIDQAKKGLKAYICIKLNNLEEEILINKLYEAADMGVEIQLIIRSICRLIPRKNISVRRIVGRYLEHARVFLFHHAGDEQLILGSADWMNRNIYHRIEVCFPIYSAPLKAEIKAMLQLQLADDATAVLLDAEGKQHPVVNTFNKQCQLEIYQLLTKKNAL
ncbi:polyphosphate kinase 1 [Sphingobacteriaceae bacterium WQ 2009]|uniref:Polyphosphate kinase n=1 Tax=Rhinopithecimicrobium faecis TaxID=2820698 RepID=A0A8T4H7G8_9SPHI|nr:polyphosphate kinase 1 [Sphingobacteriaceae bacterium WQ 2009]